MNRLPIDDVLPALRQALAERHERKKVMPPDTMRQDFRLAAQPGKPLDQVVVNLLSWGCVTDDEALADNIDPIQLLGFGKDVMFWHG